MATTLPFSAGITGLISAFRRSQARLVPAFTNSGGHPAMNVEELTQYLEDNKEADAVHP